VNLEGVSLADHHTKHQAGPEGAVKRRTNRRNVLFIAVTAAVTCLICAVIALRASYPEQTGPRFVKVFLSCFSWIRLGVEHEWTWQFLSKSLWQALAPRMRHAVSVSFPTFVFFALAAVGLTAWRVEKVSRQAEKLILVGLVLLIVLAHFALGLLSRGGLRENFFALSAPGGSNVYHWESTKIDDIRDFMADYRSRAMKSHGWQLKTHPPGPTVFFWAVHQIYAKLPEKLARYVTSVPETFTPARDESPELASLMNYSERRHAAIWTAMFLLWLAAASAAVPVYLWARDLHGRQVAVFAAAFAGVIPSLLLFSPLIDQIYPALVAWICYLGWQALERRSMVRAGAAGLLMFVGMFFTLAFLVVPAILGIVFLLRLVARIDRSVEIWQRIEQFVLLGAVVLVLFMPAWFIGMSLLPREMRPSTKTMLGMLLTVEAASIVTIAKSHDKAQMLQQTKDLLPLVGSALVCFLVPVFLLSISFDHNIIETWRHALEMNARFNAATMRSYGAWLWANPFCFVTYMGLPVTCLFVRRLLGRTDGVAIATAVVLGMLWIVGQNLGEVERLWMFAMPLCALTGAASLKRYGERLVPAGLVLLALQIAQLVVLKMYVLTVRISG